MSNATNPYVVADWTDAYRLAICHDCGETPENGHFTTVKTAAHSNYVDRYGPDTREMLREMFNVAICDKCFLRRRFEGKL